MEQEDSNGGALAPEPLPGSVREALDALEQSKHLEETVLGERLSKAYLALRRHEAERASNMTLEEEVKEYLARA